jgi:hypothetical protein
VKAFLLTVRLFFVACKHAMAFKNTLLTGLKWRGLFSGIFFSKKFFFRFVVSKNCIFLHPQYKRSHRLVWPRTPGFHPGNRGSNPLGSTKASGFSGAFFMPISLQSVVSSPQSPVCNSQPVTHHPQPETCNQPPTSSLQSLVASKQLPVNSHQILLNP